MRGGGGILFFSTVTLSAHLCGKEEGRKKVGERKKRDKARHGRNGGGQGLPQQMIQVILLLDSCSVIYLRCCSLISSSPLSTCLRSQWNTGKAHTRASTTPTCKQTHTPHYIGHSGPAPMQLQPKLRLSIIPNYRGNRAAPRQPADWLCDPECGLTHTPTLHTLQHSVYTRHTIANTSRKIIKNTPKTHSSN